MKKLTVIILIIFFYTTLFAEVFKFQFNESDAYRILSTVHEDVYLNGKLSHKAEIINRISVEVKEKNVDGSALHSARFMTTERASRTSSGEPFSWSDEYFSMFNRSPNGFYEIDDEYFMPVVRNVPIFLNEDIKIGQKWKASGYEVHDLRRSFGIDTPFKVPFEADYTYAGTVQNDKGDTLHIIKVKYTLNYESPKLDKNYSGKSFEEQDVPQYTLGYSDQTIYWDNKHGMINNYNEHFRIVIETRFGNVLEFKGTAGSEITERNKLTDETLNEVKDQIAQLDIQNTEVKSDDTGITISLENIQFMADSEILLDSEKIKLQKIALILKNFPNNDLLISGHTALAGTFNARQQLSKARAISVAQYLIDLGVKDEYHIFTQGFGAEKPVASNDTPENMARNRRVEIKIMK